MMRGWLALLLVVLGLQALVGCGDSDEGPKLTLGQPCFADEACPGGYCLEGACSAKCDRDADCGSKGSFVCGVDAAGARSCLPNCDLSDARHVCVDGIPTSCAVAPPEYCADCGCPSTLRCEVGVGCGEKRAAGEPCTVDGDCDTANCSSFAGVCRVAVGSECTTKDCDVCLVADDWSFCSRRCDQQSECGEAGVCLSDDRSCHPSCDADASASCPGKCHALVVDSPDPSPQYCDCSDCDFTEAPHPLGQWCHAAGDCESKQCDRVFSQREPVDLYEGMCAKPCTETDDCGDGFACADWDPPRCLPTCSGGCAVGTCVALPTTENTTETLCTVLRPSNGPCWEPTDCLSGKCVDGACAAAENQANGASCSRSSDCESKSCVSNSCRGTAKLGEACAIADDCAAGTCCTSGELKNTCARECP